MSKAHRGAGLRPQKKSGRGICPVCRKTGIKVVYELAAAGKKLLICKQCKAAVSNKTKDLATLAI